MTIKKILLFSIICFVILPMLLFPFITSKIYEEILLKKIDESTQQNLVQIGNNLENAINSMVAASNILISDSELMNILGKEESDNQIEAFYDYKAIDEKITRSFNAALISYHADLIMWARNKKLYSTSTEYASFEYDQVVKQDWYKDTVDLHGYVKWLTPAEDYYGFHVPGSSHNVVMTRSLRDDTASNSYGIIAISLYLDENLKKLFKTDDATGHHRLLLINNENKVIMAERDEWIGEVLSDNIDVSNPENGKRSWITDIAGDKTYVSFYHIGKTNWNVLQLIPYEDLSGEINRLRLYNFAINLVLMIVLIIISTIISNRIANPLHRLGILMSRVSDGDFHTKMKVRKGNGEIAQLSHSFNIMVSDMDKLIKEQQRSFELREKLRLEALQAQINPHFLFNTLNSIKWMAVVHGAAKVSEMISALGNLLEATLYRNVEMIPLSEELKCIENYVTLQKMRFGDTFDLTYHIPERLMDFKVPALIFQPLIENCMIHGFADRESGGKIAIQAEMRHDGVYIDIIDNGNGIDEDTLHRILSADNLDQGRFSNIGVRNVNDRIALTYGSHYGLKVSSKEGEGTAIRLKLPLPEEVEQHIKTDHR